MLTDKDIKSILELCLNDPWNPKIPRVWMCRELERIIHSEIYRTDDEIDCDIISTCIMLLNKNENLTPPGLSSEEINAALNKIYEKLRRIKSAENSKSV